MVKNILKVIVSFILVIFISNIVSASFTIGNQSHIIEKSYNAGDTITGWVNISLNNEPANSILRSSFGETITLMDLLKTISNSGFVKSCSPANCASGYIISNGETSKIIDLSENESILVGFNISGNSKDLLTSISSFTFNLTSNNPETEKFPLSIDLLNDGQDEWKAYIASENFGEEKRGCLGVPTGLANIAQVSYCERIRLSKAPEVEIGAYVKGNTENIMFFMKIESVNGDGFGSCITKPTGGIGTSERVSCLIPDFSINKEGDYFVCINTQNAEDADKYKIDYEQNNPCGFSSISGSYEGNYNYDFDIFARPKIYARNINLTLNNNELINAKGPVIDIEEYIREYVSNMYNDNCSRGCIIPLKIFSGVAQQIYLSNTNIIDSYIISYIAGISTEINEFYEVAETPALINSGLQKLYLGEAGFYTPLEYGEKTFSIFLKDNYGEQLLLSEEIRIGESAIIKSLGPTKTGVKYPTTFKVILNDSRNITQYMWNFGDGKTVNTTKEEVTYTYNLGGSYKLKITLFDSTGKIASKEFNITVSPASQIVPDLLGEAELNIAQVKSQITTFSEFEQKAINQSLKLNEIENNIATLKVSALKADSEAQFETILGELLEIKIPQTIAKTIYSEGLTFYSSGDNIDLKILKKIGGGDYEPNKEEQYKTAVLAWSEANTNAILVYNEISLIYPDYEEPFLRTFDIQITNNGESAYIIIKNMKDILFKEDYSQKEEDGFYYITLNNEEKNIIFSTTEDVNFVNLPVFVSPAISQLTLIEWTPFTKEGELKKWVLFSIILIFIILLALGIWIILQMWYKRKYENYLFKNRNNLYNLVNYIQNEKNKGVKEREIIKKLRKTGWNSEQIIYAIKKHAGKRTGMPEIPIKRIIKEKKIK